MDDPPSRVPTRDRHSSAVFQPARPACTAPSLNPQSGASRHRAPPRRGALRPHKTAPSRAVRQPGDPRRIQAAVWVASDEMATTMTEGCLFDFSRVFSARICCVPGSLLCHFGSRRLWEAAAIVNELTRNYHDIRHWFCEIENDTRRNREHTREVSNQLKRLRRLSRGGPQRLLRRDPVFRLPGTSDDTRAAVSSLMRAATKVSEATASLQAIIMAQAEQERAALRSAFSEHDDLRNGVLLASTGIEPKLDRYLNGDVKMKPSRLRKYEETLVAYVGRAAAKTSPFSTLTLVGLGRWVSSGSKNLHLSSEQFQNRTADLRLHRTLVQRLLANTVFRRPLPDHCLIQRNPTLRGEGEDLLRYYRVSPQKAEQSRSQEQLVSIPRTIPTERILELLRPSRRRTVGQLVSHLAESSSTDRATIRAYVDRLIEQQVLETVLPVYEHDIAYDDKLCKWLRRDLRPQIARVGTGMSEVLEALQDFGDGDTPERVSAKRRIDTLWDDLEDFANIPRTSVSRFYEDVAINGSHLVLDRSLLEPIERDLTLLAKVSSLFQEAQLTRARVADLLRARGPAAELGVLDLLATLEHESEETRNSGRSVSALHGVRGQMRKAMCAKIEIQRDGSLRLNTASAVGDLRGLPEWIELPEKMGFFVQKAAGEGEPWVVNYPQQGHGRFFSRFLHIMPAEIPPANDGSAKTRQDDTSEVVDIGVVNAANPNLHAPLTHHALQYPGHNHDPEWATVEVADLRAYLDSRRIPRLRCTKTGRDIRPIHFGFVTPNWLPGLARLLGAFGPISPMPLPWLVDFVPDAAVRRHVPRIYWGDVMMYRRRWNFFPKDLAKIGGTREDSKAFCMLASLARRHGLPSEVFATVDQLGTYTERGRIDQDLQEDKNGGIPNYRSDRGRKPQYLKLTSPLYLPRLQRLARQTRTCLSLEEVYPHPGNSLLTGPCGRHAIELVIELSGGAR